MDPEDKNEPRAEQEEATKDRPDVKSTSGESSLPEPEGMPIDVSKAESVANDQNLTLDSKDPADSESLSNTQSSNQSDSTADKTPPETSASVAKPTKPKIKLNKKQIIGIVAGVIVLMLVVVGIASCSTPKPLELNKHVTVNDVEFSYPSEWSLELANSANSFAQSNDSEPEGDTKSDEAEASEQDSDTGNAVYIHPSAPGVVYITDIVDEEGELIGDMDNDQLNSFLEGAGYTLKGAAKEVDLEGRHATKGEITGKINGKNYEGYFIIVDMDYTKTICVGMIEQDSSAVDLATIEAIMDSATVSVQPASYSVTFMSEGKEVSQAKVKNEGGGAVATAPSDVQREGYKLTGWKVTKGTIGTQAIESGADFKIVGIRSDTTVEAEWTQAWTVTFTDGNGNVLKEETVLNGQSATAPSTPTRDGYTFKEWSKSLSNITGNTTIDAKWTKIPTKSESNALAKAKDYLDYTAFSYSGLIKQLEYEKFSHSDAVYAADNCGANWNEQAAKKAEDYLDYTSFSRGGLIDQLLYEGFTREQAEYGVTKAGL